LNSVEENIMLYKGASIFRNIRRKDGAEWTSDDTATYLVRNMKDDTKVTEGMLSKSADSLQFNLRFTDTDAWIPKNKYLLLVWIENTVTGYSQPVLEMTITVK